MNQTQTQALVEAMELIADMVSKHTDDKNFFGNTVNDELHVIADNIETLNRTAERIAVALEKIYTRMPVKD